MTKHFDIPVPEMIDSSPVEKEMEYIPRLEDGETTLAREIVTALVAFGAAVSLAFLISLV